MGGAEPLLEQEGLHSGKVARSGRGGDASQFSSLQELACLAISLCSIFLYFQAFQCKLIYALSYFTPSEKLEYFYN